MIYAEIIMSDKLHPEFHTFCETLGLGNPATRLQGVAKKPDKALHTLAYFNMFYTDSDDLSDLRDLFGMINIAMLVVAHEEDISLILGQPHRLRRVARNPNRRGEQVLIMSGDGYEWLSAIQVAGRSLEPVLNEWGKLCHQKLVDFGLGEVMGVLRPSKNSQFLLETKKN